MQATKLYQPLDVSGRTVLITCATSGFGEALAWRRLSCGAGWCSWRGAEVHTATLDLRNLPAVTALPGSLPPPFAEVDILINNAGPGVATAESQDHQDVPAAADPNVFAVIALTREVVKGMIARNRGHIINICNDAGSEAYSGGGLYCTSKHALNAYTTAARHALMGMDIRVTTLSHGACKAGFGGARFNGMAAMDDTAREGMDPMTAEDIADNVVYAVTRPPRVQVVDIEVLPSCQAPPRGFAGSKPQQYGAWAMAHSF